MSSSSPQSKQSPLLAKPVLNLMLARRLSPVLAFRYQAIPVAEENSRITVAMVNPNDPVAVAAIATDLRANPYTVRCQAEVIEAMLAQTWPAAAYRPTRLLVWGQSDPVTAEAQAYAQRLSNLLNSHLVYLPVEAAPAALEPFQWEHLLVGPKVLRQIDQVPTALLTAYRLSWPLQKILLVAGGPRSEEAMLEWVFHLAVPERINITILPLMPAGPENGVKGRTTLTAENQPGRRLARQLTDGQIKCRLRLRQGPPEEQLRQELAETPYDLLILTTEPEDQPHSEFIRQLLRQAEQPALIIKAKEEVSDVETSISINKED